VKYTGRYTSIRTLLNLVAVYRDKEETYSGYPVLEGDNVGPLSPVKDSQVVKDARCIQWLTRDCGWVGGWELAVERQHGGACRRVIWVVLVEWPSRYWISYAVALLQLVCWHYRHGSLPPLSRSVQDTNFSRTCCVLQYSWGVNSGHSQEEYALSQFYKPRNGKVINLKEGSESLEGQGGEQPK